MRRLACLGLILFLFAPPAAADETTPICRAAASGAGAQVKALLAGGASLTASCEYDYHPIHTAVSKNNVDALQALLAAGADANDPHGYEGQTPIISVQSAAAARLLIAKGGRVGARDRNGATALSHAISNTTVFISKSETAAIASELLDHGFDVNARDKHGYSALLEASRSCYLPIVQVLLDRGADPNDRGSGETPLGSITSVGDAATQAECRQVEALLIAHGGVR